MTSTASLNGPSRGAQVLRGVAAGLLLAGLLVGPPVALLRWSTWPVTGLPSGDQLRDLPATVVSDSALLATLTVALWAVWALFAVCVLIEAAAEIRGRAARRVVPAGPLQSLARTLVASVAITIGSLAPLPAAIHPALPAERAAAAPTPQPEPVEAVGDPAAPAPPAEGGRTPQQTPDEPRVIQVVPDDDPWTLAEIHLGDGARWRELWEANRERVQPDGQRWTIGHHIEPGWTLVLPGTTATAVAPSVITVSAGDTAWDLAGTHLGDPARWPELFHANQDRPQPDGHVWSDPDRLLVGWQLAVPGATPEPTAAAPADAPAGPPPAEADDSTQAQASPPTDPSSTAGVETGEPSDTNDPAITTPQDQVAPTGEDGPDTDDHVGARPPAAPDAPPSPPADEPDTAQPPDTPSTTATSTTAEPRQAAPPQAGANAERHAANSGGGDESDRVAERDDTDESPGAPAVPLLGAAGTVLAVALLRAWRRRRAARAARLPLTAVPPPPPRTSRPAAREMLAGDEAAVDRLDAALASLAAGLRPRSGQPCVQPRLMQVRPERIEVLMDRADPAAPSPWRPEASGLVWVLDAADGAALSMPEDDPPSQPALVTIGVGESTLHVDVEAFGVLSLTGDPEACRGLARSMTTELAARADGTMALEIIGDPLETSADGLPGVSHVDDWDAVSPSRLRRLVDELDAGRWPHTFAARASGRRAHAWVPFTWLTAPTDHPHYHEAIDIVTRRPGASSAIVVVGADDSRGLRIDLDAEGGFTIPDFGLSGHAQRLDAGTIDQAVALLTDADHVPIAQTFDFPAPDPEEEPRSDARPAAPDIGDVPVRAPAGRALVADDDRGYRDADFEVLVRVCGDIRVEGGRERLANLETAVAVYIALQGETTVDRIRDAIWNGTAVTHKRVRNVISNLRSTLGGGAIRWVDEGRVATGEALVTDLELIRRRLAYATAQPDPAHRAEIMCGGLEWVTGRVCTYPATSGWAWVDLENWIPHVESSIGTLACDLAGLALDLGDADAACWAASKGIEATGQREHLAVLLARGYEQAGDIPAVRATLASYLAHAAEYGIDEHSDDLRALLDRYPMADRGRAAS